MLLQQYLELICRFRLTILAGPEHQVFKDAAIRLRLKVLGAIENSVQFPSRVQLSIIVEDMHGHVIDTILKV